MPRPRTILRTTLLTLSLITLITLAATRWITLDLETGTSTIITITQGAAVIVKGETPAPFDLDMDANEQDQTTWQWAFRSEPHSQIVPLWPVLGVCALAAVIARKPASAPTSS